MNKYFAKTRKLYCFLVVSIITSITVCKSQETGNKWAYDALNIPRQHLHPKKKVTVAVIDDAFRLSHKSLSKFIYSNENEATNNYRDDDNNGFINDIHGWDISDNDNDVSIPEGREDAFYHGTHIAGIITEIFRLFYGSEAENYLEIIPVKVLADDARNTSLTDGYKGLKYAVNMRPDIIYCAWNGGEIPDEIKSMLKKASENGTIIVGSAGNFSQEKIESPAFLPNVFSVAAVDSSSQKANISNFAMNIDISAPGTHVYGPSSVADNAFFHSDGTSPAAAIIAGCFAGLKAYKPDATAEELKNALKDTSIPIDGVNPGFAGKLGAGTPDITNAIKYLEDKAYKYTVFNPLRPQGTIFYKKNESPASFEITPEGAFKGIHFFSSSADYKGNVILINSDSVFYSGKIHDLYKGIFVPGSTLKVELQPTSKLSKEMAFNYYVETIDSTILYCKGTQLIKETKGIIADGSGNDDYANYSSCKWELKVPEGKKIRIEFAEIDTQENVDFVWIFDGKATLQENLLAKFSGKALPPAITSLSNQVLIWFVTDGAATGKGWQLHYEPTDESIVF